MELSIKYTKDIAIIFKDLEWGEKVFKEIKEQIPEELKIKEWKRKYHFGFYYGNCANPSFIGIYNFKFEYLLRGKRFDIAVIQDNPEVKQYILENMLSVLVNGGEGIIYLNNDLKTSAKVVN